MTSFKTKVIAVALMIGIFMITSWFYEGKLKDKDIALRKEKEKHTEVVQNHNKIIGDYVTTVGQQEQNLEDANSLIDQQKRTIRELEKDLGVQVEIINALTVQIDSIYDQGVAEIILTGTDTIQYHIDEYKDHVSLTFNLEHPTGKFNYVITHDPLKMELYLSKEKNSEVKIGSIVFPENPHIRVTSWDIFYDPDTRPWYKRFLDNIHLDVGAFSGQESGLMGFVGYKKISVGPVFTEEGQSLGLMYRIK